MGWSGRNTAVAAVLAGLLACGNGEVTQRTDAIASGAMCGSIRCAANEVCTHPCWDGLCVSYGGSTCPIGMTPCSLDGSALMCADTPNGQPQCVAAPSGCDALVGSNAAQGCVRGTGTCYNGGRDVACACN
jgi:hypothetical protein